MLNMFRRFFYFVFLPQLPYGISLKFENVGMLAVLSFFEMAFSDIISYFSDNVQQKQN